MNQKIIRIIVVGASGRTGSRVCELARRDDRFELVAAVVGERSASVGAVLPPVREGQKPLELASIVRDHADVVIDFSSDLGTRAAVGIATTIGAALLVATTSLTPETRASIDRACGKVPIIISPNTSLGVTALADAAARLARALGAGFAASIVEAHHIRKKDAPSGTALRLASAVREAGGSLADDQIHAIRAGDIVGEHVVRFTGPAEEVIIEHRAMSRDVFALGALRVAAWLAGKPAGRYTMEDVLGFSRASR